MFPSLSLSKKSLAEGAIVLSVTALGLFALSYFGVDLASAQLVSPEDAPGNITDATGGEGSFRTLARTIVNFFLYFLGFIATLMIIYGGFLYTTAAGGENTEKAKKVIIYAVVGMIVILLSWAIVNTVLSGAGTGDISAT